uniref:Zinc finger CCHC-type and RNA-binding motif-containing protein 1 n=1 Tax=Rhizophora mucronata TaxID=61149 RepID=A0A2P2PDT2_RHIMU
MKPLHFLVFVKNYLVMCSCIFPIPSL